MEFFPKIYTVVWTCFLAIQTSLPDSYLDLEIFFQNFLKEFIFLFYNLTLTCVTLPKKLVLLVALFSKNASIQSRMIAAPTKAIAAACREGYIYLVEPLIFRVQICNCCSDLCSFAYRLEPFF